MSAPKEEKKYSAGDNRYSSGQNHFYRCYITRAKMKNFEFDLSMEQFFGIASGICFYCGDLPRSYIVLRALKPVVTNGLDRLDSSKGYIASNVVACCTTCNRMKSKMNVTEFISRIRKIRTKTAKF